MEKPKCPSCGYELKKSDSIAVSDWNSMTAIVELNEDRKLADPTWEASDCWKNEEEVYCPNCGDPFDMKNVWGLKWNWE